MLSVCMLYITDGIKRLVSSMSSRQNNFKPYPLNTNEVYGSSEKTCITIVKQFFKIILLSCRVWIYLP